MSTKSNNPTVQLIENIIVLEVNNILQGWPAYIINFTPQDTSPHIKLILHLKNPLKSVTMDSDDEDRDPTAPLSEYNTAKLTTNIEVRVFVPKPCYNGSNLLNESAKESESSDNADEESSDDEKTTPTVINAILVNLSSVPKDTIPMKHKAFDGGGGGGIKGGREGGGYLCTSQNLKWLSTHSSSQSFSLITVARCALGVCGCYWYESVEAVSCLEEGQHIIICQTSEFVNGNLGQDDNGVHWYHCILGDRSMFVTVLLLFFLEGCFTFSLLLLLSSFLLLFFLQLSFYSLLPPLEYLMVPFLFLQVVCELEHCKETMSTGQGTQLSLEA
ncbi:hypothetical protein EDC04DRAFT_2611659 [Pisolithus marmoratus]|nr:hypothetical protein EDC04DRAFT_2611659 [Pisolithus marmoratus]